MQEIKLKINGGTLILWTNQEDYSQAGIQYQPDDINEAYAIDLVLVEKSIECLSKNINIYVYSNPFTEDWQEKFTISHDDIVKALS